MGSERSRGSPELEEGWAGLTPHRLEQGSMGGESAARHGRDEVDVEIVPLGGSVSCVVRGEQRDTRVG